MVDVIRTSVIRKRHDYDIGIRQAAEYIGISQGILRRFEAGGEISATNFIKCATWVDYKLHYAKSYAPGAEYRDEVETAHVE